MFMSLLCSAVAYIHPPSAMLKSENMLGLKKGSGPVKVSTIGKKCVASLSCRRMQDSDSSFSFQSRRLHSVLCVRMTSDIGLNDGLQDTAPAARGHIEYEGQGSLEGAIFEHFVLLPCASS